MGTYRPDFIIEGKMNVELKALTMIPKKIVNQLYDYLGDSEFELGFLIDFGGNKLYIKRIIYTNDHKPWFKEYG